MYCIFFSTRFWQKILKTFKVTLTNLCRKGTLVPRSVYLCRKKDNLYGKKFPVLNINPFHPTGPFLAPKLIILIVFNWFIISQCCFNVSLCSTRCEFAIAIMFRYWQLKNKEERWKKSGKKMFSQSGWNGLINYNKQSTSITSKPQMPSSSIRNVFAFNLNSLLQVLYFNVDTFF